jgi:hypothetical protein
MHISIGFRTKMLTYCNFAVSVFQSTQLRGLYNYITVYFLICYDV